MYIMEDKHFMYMERDVCTRKETYVHRKRPMRMKERDICIWKETYVYRKRPMYIERKGRVYMSILFES